MALNTIIRRPWIAAWRKQLTKWSISRRSSKSIGRLRNHRSAKILPATKAGRRARWKRRNQRWIKWPSAASWTIRPRPITKSMAPKNQPGSPQWRKESGLRWIWSNQSKRLRIVCRKIINLWRCTYRTSPSVRSKPEALILAAQLRSCRKNRQIG